MRFALVLFILAVSICASAYDVESVIVKVRSHNPNTGVKFEGSGVLVEHDNKVYVLTSEHVVLHDNVGSKHFFQFNDQTQNPMTYLQSEWGTGLALLSTALKADGTRPTFDELSLQQKPALQSAAMSVGFPLTSLNLLVDPDGKVGATERTSNILADVPKMLEVVGAHAEFGMSGGAVVNADAKILGILSHISINDAEKTVYAIPIQLAAAWALKFIRDPAALPQTFRTSGDLTKRRVRVGKFIIYELHGIEVRWHHDAWNLGPNPPLAPKPHRFFDLAYARIKPYLDKDDFEHRRYPRVVLSGIRPKDLQHPSEITKITTPVHFFRAIDNPKTRPAGNFLHAGFNLPWFDNEYMAHASRLSAYGYQKGFDPELRRKL